jgi:hypothetical protein
LVRNKESCNFVVANKKITDYIFTNMQNIKEINTETAIKQIDWQFPNDNEMTAIEDFKEMVRNSENAPHISFDEFCEVTDEWLNR